MKIISRLISPVKRWHKIRRIKLQYNAKNLIVRQYLTMNPMPELSTEDIKVIDEYWAQYGIKYRDYSWFRWFSGVWGEIDPRFIPNDIYAYIIWPYYDNEEFRNAWKDKNYFERFLPDVSFPKVVLKKINGRFYDENNTYYSESEINKVIKLLVNEGSVIVKDAWDSGEGRGVTKYKITTEADAEEVLNEWKSDNYLVQEVVKQHPILSQFNESSVNIMRISSWYHNGKVEILAPTLRIGTPGYDTDVCFINGFETIRVVGITKDGYFKDTVVTHDGRKKKISDIVENSMERIPCWDEIINIIKDSHPQLGHFDIIGWDFTVTPDETPICIEYNIQRPGTVFYQYVNGPFFGESTEDVLNYLRDKKNQDYYIPKWLKA